MMLKKATQFVESN